MVEVIRIKNMKKIILMPENDEIQDDEWLRAASSNPVFEFLNYPIEDIYTCEDGKAFNLYTL